jgi:hypothetical protein
LAQRLLERDVISGNELKSLLGTAVDEFVVRDSSCPQAAAR